MRDREAGFTLIELFSVLAIGSVVMAAAAGVAVHAHRSSIVAADSAAVVREATRTLEAVEADLRGASSIEEAGPGVLRGVRGGAAFEWRVVGGDLVREADAGRTVFLHGIGSLDARRRGRLVEVTLEYGPRRTGGTPPLLHTAVAIRAGEGPR